MSALTSLLARDAVVPVQVIEDALQRQVLEGGDIETALLESEVLPENVLSAYRAATFGLQPVSREELVGVSDDTLKLLPMDVARRLRVVPMHRSGGALVVCASRPLTPDEHRDLEQVLGMTAVVRVAVGARVDIALATYYGVEVTARIRALAESLEQAPAGLAPEVAPSSNLVVHLDSTQRSIFDSAPPLPPQSDVDGSEDRAEPGDTVLEFDKKSAPEHLSSEPRDTLVDDSLPGTAAVADPQPARRAVLSIPAHPTSLPPGGPGRSRPHFRRVSTVPKGPLSADRARQLLEVAVDRDAVVDVYFSFAKQYFDCSAFFSVRDGVLHGIEAYGLSDVEAPDDLRITVGDGGLVDDVLRSLLPRVAHLERSDADAALLASLGRGDGQPSALIPIVIKQRVVSLLYGDRDGEVLRLEDFGELLGMVPNVVRALLRVIRERKLYAGRAPLGSGKPQSPVSETAATERMSAVSSNPPPNRAPETREALAALGMSRPAPRLPDLSVPPAVSHRSPETARPAAAGRGLTSRGAHASRGVGVYRSVPGTEERVGPIEDPYKTAAARPQREPRTAQPKPEPSPPRTESPSAEPALPASNITTLSTLPPPRRTSREPAVLAAPVLVAAVQQEKSPTLPVNPRGRRRAEEGRPEDDAPLARQDKRPAPTPTSSEGHDAPLSGQLGSAMPSIIVDMGADVDRLVEELCGCGPDDEASIVQSLLRLSPAPLPALVARFPGRLWFDRRTQHQRLPAGRDISAVARALSAFAGQAAPYVAQLLSSADADKRFYALLLASDRVDGAYLKGLVAAAFDPDPQVRILARETLPAYRATTGYAEALASVRASASDASAAVQRRLDAIEALCAARDVDAFEVLVELNAHRDRQLAVPAHRALMLLTGRDFGTSTRKWRAFAKQMSGRSRAEWLIDGLTQSDEHLRATAGSELQRLTQVYFGYLASAPKRERERVQRRYREWWDQQQKSA